MALVDKKSMLDRNLLGASPTNPTADLSLANGETVGKNVPSDGKYFTQLGTLGSPFDSDLTENPASDHLLTLARDTTVTSLNSQIGLNSNQGGTGTYDPAIMQELMPKDPAFVDQDLDTLTPTRYLDNLPPGA
jgi:hypothetical protein